MAVEQQTTINVPVEKAFDYLADISKHGEWSTPGHKLEVKKTSDGPVGQGATFASVGHQFGENNDAITITEYVPNQRVVYEATGNAGLVRHSFEFAPADGGTRVTKTFDTVQTKFPFTIFAPMAKMFVVPGGLKGDLERIKARLES
jgi:uncharacterized protein YndB with AHSA1/START domain